MKQSRVGIIGYGSARYDKRPTRTLYGYLMEAAREALSTSGVKKDEIDGLAVDAVNFAPDNAVTAAEFLGISISWSEIGTSGGASTITAVANAVRAVEQGQAKYVLCLGGGAQDVAMFQARIAKFNSSIADYLAPHGFGGMPGIFALVQRKHMQEYGTTREQMGRLAVDFRVNAQANDNALLRGTMSLADYMNAPMIAEPLGLYDCVMPCAGADAILVGPLDRVPSGKGVRVLSAHERHNRAPGELAPLQGGWVEFRESMYDEAGFGTEDMDFVQLYDDFPIMAAIQLEDLGFCAKGEAGRFIEANRFTYDGTLPVNTGGGQLSSGQAGGAAGLLAVVEAVRQIRGEADRRQVPSAKRGVVSGFGMISYGRGLAASAAVLEGV